MERHDNDHRARLKDLLRHVPRQRASVLEVGARDGFISRQLLPFFEEITAIDIVTPSFEHERIHTLTGDVRRLDFPDTAFDVVVCAEVLEHIPPEDLPGACAEIARVVRHEAVIGVPYRQDVRCAKTTCPECGRVNPAWGHFNSFDEDRLRALFSPLQADAFSFVGRQRARTNPVSSALMTLAGNPWGAYDELEHCRFCNAVLKPFAPTMVQKAVAKPAFLLDRLQLRMTQERPIWIHMLFRKR